MFPSLVSVLQLSLGTPTSLIREINRPTENDIACSCFGSCLAGVTGNEATMLHAAMQIAATWLALMNISMQHLKLAHAADFSLVSALHGGAP